MPSRWHSCVLPQKLAPTVSLVASRLGPQRRLQSGRLKQLAPTFDDLKLCSQSKTDHINSAAAHLSPELCHCVCIWGAGPQGQGLCTKAPHGREQGLAQQGGAGVREAPGVGSLSCCCMVASAKPPSSLRGLRFLPFQTVLGHTSLEDSRGSWRQSAKAWPSRQVVESSSSQSTQAPLLPGDPFSASLGSGRISRGRISRGKEGPNDPQETLTFEKRKASRGGL